MAQQDNTLEKVVGLCKRRGFIYPSSEIYGGMANTYDYGPYGAALKENLKQLWWKKFISNRDDLYGIDSSIIINPKVWEASGHVASFADVMVEDKVNHRRYKADQLIEEFYAKQGKEVVMGGKSPEELQQIIDENKIKSPDGNEITPARSFNTLFKTQVGIIVGEGSDVYLRGEIAQGLFINFRNILDSIHPKLPFGIGQAGKAFRNEITKGQFTFRTLEFDLMEFEYFFDPETTKWEELFDYWTKQMKEFADQLGFADDKLRWREHSKEELAHYSKKTADLEYKFPWGFKEMWGCAYRTNFDLSNHEKFSGKEMQYTYPDGKKVTPHVIEPTFGLSRLVTIVLMDKYHEEEVNGEIRVVLKLPASIAPVKLAVLPLVKKDGLAEKAEEIHKAVREKFSTEYDESGSIGKRYRRQDEIGTPFCVTVDYQTMEDNTVTIRDRDTLAQVRIKISEVESYVSEKIQ